MLKPCSRALEGEGTEARNEELRAPHGVLATEKCDAGVRHQIAANNGDPHIRETSRLLSTPSLGEPKQGYASRSFVSQRQWQRLTLQSNVSSRL